MPHATPLLCRRRRPGHGLHRGSADVSNWSGSYVGADAGGTNGRLKVSGTRPRLFQLTKSFRAARRASRSDHRHPRHDARLCRQGRSDFPALWRLCRRPIAARHDRDRRRGRRPRPARRRPLRGAADGAADPAGAAVDADTRRAICVRIATGRRGRGSGSPPETIVYATGGYASARRATWPRQLLTPAGAAAAPAFQASDLPVPTSGQRGRTSRHRKRPAPRVAAGGPGSAASSGSPAISARPRRALSRLRFAHDQFQLRSPEAPPAKAGARGQHATDRHLPARASAMASGGGRGYESRGRR